MNSIYQKVAVATLGAVISLATFEATPSQSIIYNEALSGDLGFDLPVFALDLGANTFTGEVTFSAVDNPVSDFDSFTFSVPDGTSLESILADISLLPGGSGIFNQVVYTLVIEPSFIPISSDLITIPSTNLSLFTSSLPLGSGQFTFFNSGLGGGVGTGDFQTAAYTLSFNVAQTKEVPEPSTLAGLVCLGLGSLLIKKKSIV